MTDANIDATYDRTLYDSNVVIYVGIPTSTFLISLNNIINNRLTHWLTRQGKGLAKTAPFMEFFALFSELSDWINGAMPVLATVVRYQR